MTLLDDFRNIYNQPGPRLIASLDSLYAPDVVFTDPARTIHGLGELKHYMEDLYSGVESCRFDFREQVTGAGQAFSCWEMTLVHRRLRPGQPVTIRGASYLEFGERITVHRDYFDLGALIYERVPVLGVAVKAIRNRL